MSDTSDSERRSGSGNGWFWLGAGVGFLVSTATVVITNEFLHIRRSKKAAGIPENEYDLVEDLHVAVHDGINVLAQAATSLKDSFSDVARERIRFSLDPVSGTGAGSHAWYTGEEDE